MAPYGSGGARRDVRVNILRSKVPVLLHVESTRMNELSQMLERFADVPVIWAHGGYTPLFLASREGSAPVL